VHRRIPVGAGTSSGLYRIDGRKVDASKSVSGILLGTDGGMIHGPGL
jgi:hypothetical protein